jgi:hypothetical protein
MIASALRNAALAVLVAVLAGCASAPPPAATIDYKSRAVTRTEGNVRVSAAVLSAQESLAVYGLPLATKSVQPVWIEVENREDRPYFLLSPGLDPNFFPASEAAEAFATDESHDSRAELDRRFRQLAFRNPVLPGATTSGFVLANLDEGFKFVQLDLVGNGRTRTFSILTLVPGFRADYHASEVFRRGMYPSEKSSITRMTPFSAQRWRRCHAVRQTRTARRTAIHSISWSWAASMTLSLHSRVAAGVRPRKSGQDQSRR